MLESLNSVRIQKRTIVSKCRNVISWPPWSWKYLFNCFIPTETKKYFFCIFENLILFIILTEFDPFNNYINPTNIDRAVVQLLMWNNWLFSGLKLKKRRLICDLEWLNISFHICYTYWQNMGHYDKHFSFWIYIATIFVAHSILVWFIQLLECSNPVRIPNRTLVLKMNKYYF
jgi:hypothetical protein